MATKKAVAKTKPAAATGSDISTMPAGVDLSQYAGEGLEGADRDSFAIPFLAIMQKGSPQVDKDADTFVPGAEVGDLMLTTTGQIFKDEDGVDLIFCGYRRVYLRWAPENAGGGFKGEVAVDEVVRGKASGEFVETDNKLFANNGDLIRDTRVHYVLVLNEDGIPIPAVLSVSSTQIKKSKALLTQIQSYSAKDSKGNLFNPPMFAHVFHAETIAESNDKGSWRGWKFTRKSYVESPDIFKVARDFYETTKSDTIKVDHAHSEGAAPEYIDAEKI